MTWSQRPTQLRDRITAAKTELERLDAENDLPLPQEGSALLAEAHRWALQAHRRELSELTAAHDGIHARQTQVVAETERLGEELRNTRRRLEIAGMTQVLGQILIDRRQKLPDRCPYCREAKEREQTIVAAMLKQIRYDKEALRLRDPDSFVATLAMDYEGPLPSDLHDELRELAQARASLLTKITAATDTYLHALGDLEYASGRLIETITDYDDYLAAHLLWVRSASPVGPATLNALPGAIAWFFSPPDWLQVVRVFVREVAGPSLLWLPLLGLLLLRWRARAIRAAIPATAHPSAGSVPTGSD